MIKTKTLKNIGISVAVGLGVVFAIVGLSEITLGDLTNSDSLAPLVWCIPVLTGVAAWIKSVE